MINVPILFHNQSVAYEIHVCDHKNQLQFLNDIAKIQNILNPFDWKIISPTLLNNLGGYGLLKQHNGSMKNILSFIVSSS